MTAESHLDVAPRGLRELPRAGWAESIRSAVQNARRIDMLTPLRRLHERYGNGVLHRLAPMPMVNLFGPDANRLVLLDRDGIFSARKPWMAIMGRIFPNGLLLRDGAEHKHQRKIMHEAFKRAALRSYAERMNPMIAAGIAAWGDGDGRRLAFHSYKELTLDIAASIFVGARQGGRLESRPTRSEPQANEVDPIGPETRQMNGVFEAMVAASMSMLRLPLRGLEFQRGLAGREHLVASFRDTLARKRAEGGDDMFARLARAENEAGDRLADADVIDHMIFLMMAAHDTTTSTLSSLTYELARHPDWQERVREEAFASGREQLGFDGLDGATTLGWVIQETLRRYPPLPVIPRIAEAEFEFEGMRVPAGALVVVSPIHTHHMPEWFRAPYLFDPERFAPGRAEHERHTHCWIPFGGGPHHCLGLRFAEMQVAGVMHQLLRRYRIHVAPGYRMPVQQAPISKPRDGLPVRFERID